MCTYRPLVEWPSVSVLVDRPTIDVGSTKSIIVGSAGTMTLLSGEAASPQPVAERASRAIPEENRFLCMFVRVCG
ncbi:hypothetical protein GCM10020216_076760 [Nonomuraea helvata]